MYEWGLRRNPQDNYTLEGYVQHSTTIYQHVLMNVKCYKIDVRVRFAPSPAGQFHFKGLRTALHNY